MTEVGFAAFDADNHYYEATDAFIRHVDPKMHKRCMQWATVDGRERLLVAGRINRFIPNPTFDPVARPGCLDDYFRSRIAAANMREAFGKLEPISAAYRNRDARIELADPVSFVHDLDGFSNDEIELVMRTNGLSLTERAAA